VTGKDFEDQIADQLTKAGLTFERKPAIGGVKPDFVITGPGQHVVVVEAKAWDPGGGHTARALAQAAYYQSLVGAAKAFVVLPTLGRSLETKGLVSADNLIVAVKRALEKPESARGVPARVGYKRTRRRTIQTPTIFAAMPFDREYDDTYFVAMSYAADRVRAACVRVDKEEFSGNIVEEIRHLIKASAAVIVDLSEGKANVLYEAGFADALGKPTVHICCSPTNELPFDVRGWNTVQYVRGQTIALREPLARRLGAVIE